MYIPELGNSTLTITYDAGRGGLPWGRLCKQWPLISTMLKAICNHYRLPVFRSICMQLCISFRPNWLEHAHFYLAMLKICAAMLELTPLQCTLNSTFMRRGLHSLQKLRLSPIQTPRCFDDHALQLVYMMQCLVPQNAANMKYSACQLVHCHSSLNT